jgi:hypothetical protein
MLLVQQVERFILETIMDQNWQLFLSFMCLNLAYLFSKFTMCYYFFCGAGLVLLISTIFDTFSVSILNSPAIYCVKNCYSKSLQFSHSFAILKLKKNRYFYFNVKNVNPVLLLI